MASNAVLEVERPFPDVPDSAGEVKAVQDVNFRLDRGQSLGLVGGVGCGKSSVANCLMGLLPDNARGFQRQVILAA